MSELTMDDVVIRARQIFQDDTYISWPEDFEEASPTDFAKQIIEEHADDGRALLFSLITSKLSGVLHSSVPEGVEDPFPDHEAKPVAWCALGRIGGHASYTIHASNDEDLTRELLQLIHGLEEEKPLAGSTPALRAADSQAAGGLIIWERTDGTRQSSYVHPSGIRPGFFARFLKHHHMMYMAHIGAYS